MMAPIYGLAEKAAELILNPPTGSSSSSGGSSSSNGGNGNSNNNNNSGAAPVRASWVAVVGLVAGVLLSSF
jgi:hypothetical protein